MNRGSVLTICEQDKMSHDKRNTGPCFFPVMIQGVGDGAVSLTLKDTQAVFRVSVEQNPPTPCYSEVA